MRHEPSKLELLKNFLLLGGIISAMVFIGTFAVAPLELKIISKVIPGLVLCCYVLLGGLTKHTIFIFLGLGFSTLGDYLMIFSSEAMVSLGIGVNLAGIIMYLVYFLGFSRALGLVHLGPVFVMVGVLYVLLFENLGRHVVPVFFYCSFFILLAWRAGVAKDHEGGTKGLALYWSVLSLIVSDSILSLMLFGIIEFRMVMYGIEMVLWWGGLYGLAYFSSKVQGQNKTVSSW